jgi:hypothetical protein
MALPFYEEGSSVCRPPATLVSLPFTSIRIILCSWDQTTLKNLYKRAFGVYAAFTQGLGNTTTSDPGDPDELEVVGGRKSVVTTKSNTNLPATSTADYDADGGGSPGSQLNTPELLMEYYEQLDNHPSTSQDYEMYENNATSGNLFQWTLENTPTTEHGRRPVPGQTSIHTPSPVPAGFNPNHTPYSQADQHAAFSGFNPELSHHHYTHTSPVSHGATAFETSMNSPIFLGQGWNQAEIWGSFMSEFGTQL